MSHRLIGSSYEAGCWACTYRDGMYGGQYSGAMKRKADWRMELYERCVETLEQFHPGPFTIMEAWRVGRSGPEGFGLMQHAVRDLAMHGMIVCVKRDRSGKCRLWRWA